MWHLLPRGVCHPSWLIFAFLVETGFHHIGQAALELLTSRDPLVSASQSAGIIGVSPHARLDVYIIYNNYYIYIYNFI